MVCIGLVLALADVLLMALVGLACGIADNLPASRERFCHHAHPDARLLVPLVGAGIVLASIPISRRTRRGWIFGLGALLAIATGAYLWVVASC